MEPVLASSPARKFIVELLSSTRSNETASVDVVATHTRCSSDFALKVLSRLNIAPENGRIALPPSLRMDLAIEAARWGSMVEAGKVLDWQEFERFAERCLAESGYEVERDVRVKGGGRNWQIDVVGARENLVLCLDCKHWTTPSTPSRFKTAEEHQVTATRHLARRIVLAENRSVMALPIILTLFDPPSNLSRDVVLLSLQKLPSMLQELTPYSPGLPFLVAQPGAENPIRQNTG